MSDVHLAPDGNIAVCRRVVAVKDAVRRVAGVMAIAPHTSVAVMTTWDVAWITSRLLPLLDFKVELWVVPRVKLRLGPRALIWCRLDI